MRHIRSVGLAALGVALLLAACGGSDDDAGDGVRPQSAAPDGTVAGSAPVVVAGDATPAPPGSVHSQDSQPAAASVPTSQGSDSTLLLSEIVVLEPDGLGFVSFGDAADEAIAALTAVLGEPSRDSGWVEPLVISTCPGTEARAIAWGSLYLYFSDESKVATGTRHLFGYSYGDVSSLDSPPEGLSTEEGIGLGTSVEFLRAAYRDVVIEAGDEGVVEPNFYVDESLSGRLTGGEDDDLVTVIIGGDPCVVGM